MIYSLISFISSSYILYNLITKISLNNAKKYNQLVIEQSQNILSSSSSSSSSSSNSNSSSSNSVDSNSNTHSVDPFSSIIISNKVFSNRIIKAATYEAMCDKDGIPQDTLISFHEKMSKGGSGMCIVAYGAISPEGRSFPAQLICRKQSKNMLLKLTNTIHNNGSLACIQLTHAGYFADRKLSTILNYHEQMSSQSIFNPAALSFCRAMTENDYIKLCSDYVKASLIAIESGFDCIELHCGHGYLISQFLSPKLNPNKTLKERLEFPLKIIKSIKDAIGNKAILMIKMNLVDGMNEGLSIEESCIIAREFANLHVDIIGCSGGLILENGLFMLRGNVPLQNMIISTTDYLKKFGLLVFGRILIPKINYEEMYFRCPGKCILQTIKKWNNEVGKQNHKVYVCLMGGIQNYDSLNIVTKEDGFDFIQSGRAVLHDPDIVNRWKEQSEIDKNNEMEYDNNNNNNNSTNNNKVLNKKKQIKNIDSLCTKCNHCIVDATMKQKPISCVEW